MENKINRIEEIAEELNTLVFELTNKDEVMTHSQNFFMNNAIKTLIKTAGELRKELNKDEQ